MNKYQINCYHITRRFVPENASETEKKIHELMDFLQKKEHQNTVISTLAGASITEEMYENYSVKRFHHNYPYLNLNKQDREFLDETIGNPHCKGISKFLKKSSDVDIYHIHTSGRIAVSVTNIAKKYKIPYIVSVFTDADKLHFEKLEKIKKRIIDYGKFIDAFSKDIDIFSEAAGIICYDHKKFILLKEKYPDKNIIPAFCAIDLEEFQIVGSHDFRKKYKISPTSELVLFESDIDLGANQIRLLELAEHLRSQKENFHFLFIGKIKSKNYLQKMQQKIDEAKLHNMITIISDLSSDLNFLKQAYEAADYFINPATKWSQNEQILKAWASRVPVISFQSEGSGFLFDNKKNCYLYKKDDLRSLADSLNFVRTNSGFRVRLIQNSFNQLKNNFTRKQIHKNILELYRKISQNSSE
ncbi:MAG: glycosyltransferase family 4 protein [Candidatus Cloacimonetes bacterium]|nr:glycosyltransferase family 4 protein [Candidatus Cloacimonadota bacterium]MCF7813096.1 glycosyltransferase family 4 protein [Candidatus Cloacimonadota bacterium]MCF7867545.1 glycosyltransferase family 4 protein [Candidatus Cloacimonadota bacterium]MCF7883061.1 glycosyltransferase family 4 protein [Candidatus Cloacimonadota bacterium]